MGGVEGRRITNIYRVPFPPVTTTTTITTAAAAAAIAAANTTLTENIMTLSGTGFHPDPGSINRDCNLGETIVR